ncbi:hypothetical protein BCR33DRAFT_719934 [Rhizoclosmatium globosum]|uniref:Uncharacterized protein n=1 Tax=Rhizoclosmatium globosum TaxID=329046 RepID=A0A1Y2BY80_9FUNG|nr:hypothetical protein BCR33DRAFT_719934 [Rhizoclosmatium globosum]|eukprot:ORY39730.1 hypothetical protein BCR33DRAFT_719934 [Rhizoclosmatium globosum]
MAAAVQALLEPYPTPLAIKIVPSDGAKLDSNPPSFWWSGFDSAPKTYKLEVSSPTQTWTFTDLTNNYFTLPFELPTNTTYSWRVTKYKPGSSATSAIRKFQLLAGAESIGILAPDFASQVANAPHPRLLPNGLARTKYLASPDGIGYPTRIKNEDWYFTNCNNATLMPDSNLTAASFPAGSQALELFLSKVAADVNTLTKAIYTYSWSLWLNPSNAIHFAELRRRMLSIAAYNVTGATGAASQDQANRDIMLSLSMAYDVVKSNLTESERASVVAAIRARGLQVYNGGTEIKGLLMYPHDSHGANTLGFLSCTALAMAGEFPEAVQWLNETLPMYIALYSTWSTEDGGFGNGLGYAFFDATDSPQRWNWMSSASGVNVVGKQWIRNWPLQFIYFSPPYADSVGVGFGDSGEMDATFYRGIICGSLISRVLGDTSSILTQAQRNLYLWYCDRVNANKYTDDRYYGHMWLANFSPVPQLTDVAMNAAGYAAGIYLRQIGWVAMHSTLFSPNRTSLYFRCGPFGSYNHNSADQLSFTLSHRGQSFLIASDKAQSGGVTLSNDQGQRINSFTSVGAVKQWSTTDAFDAVTGSAVDAYNDGYTSKQVTRASRSIIYLRGTNKFIIQDQFDSPTPQNWSWNFHSYKAVTQLGPGRVMVPAPTGNATVYLRVLNPDSLVFSQTNLFPANAQTSLPNQNHAKWQVWSPTTSFSLVVVVDPDCTNSTLVEEAGILANRSVALPDGTHLVFDGDLLHQV